MTLIFAPIKYLSIHAKVLVGMHNNCGITSINHYSPRLGATVLIKLYKI
jgi:hypothetical protein